MDLGIENWFKIQLLKPSIFTVGFLYSVFIVIKTLFRVLVQGRKIVQVKRRSQPPKCLSDPKYGKHGFVQLQDVRLHYVENGDRKKPLMLFVHGFPDFWLSWIHQMKHFSSDYWVVAVDLRGFGESDKPPNQSDYSLQKLELDIYQFVRALNRESCILVGHDWGGVLSYNIAARFPQLVEKLITMNAPHPATFENKRVWTVDQVFKSWYTHFYQIPLLPEWYMRLNDMEVLSSIYADTSGKLIMAPDMLEAYKYMLSRKGAWTPPINLYRENLLSFLTCDPSIQPQVKVPTLLIWGEADIALSLDYPELARPHVKTLTIGYIPNGGHFINQDKPDQVIKLMQDFI